MTTAIGSTPSEKISRKAGLGVDFIVGLICLLLLVATSPILPLVWDEPNAIERADKLVLWLRLWWHLDPGQGFPWEAAAIQKYCPYTTVIEGHPDFYGFVIAFGRLITEGWLPPKESYRFGPMLLFAIATAALFHRLRQQQSLVVAIMSVLCLLTMPRLFAHAHFASIDGPLTACWVLTWATFDWARRSKVGCLTWGILLGLTMSCKFTGWMAVGGFVVWSLVYRDWDGWRVLLIGGVTACITFINVNPMLWGEPFSGLLQFFSLNLHRANNGLNIPVQFFGTRYDLKSPLPWYNAFVWIVLTVPVGTVVLAGLGSVCSIRSWRIQRPAVLLFLQMMVLVVIKALPQSPPHDAERLFLPSFAFLAGMAGIGAGAALKFAQTTKWALIPSKLLLALFVISSCAETVWYSPQWLSYYSPVIGGLRGATRMGFEPTYYWDSLDREVISWLESQSAPETRVHISVSLEYARFLNHTSGSKLQFSSNPEDCEWHVIQNRPGMWTFADRRLIESQTPSFKKMIRDPAAGIGPWQMDVPVLFVFSHEQWVSEQSDSR